MHSQQQVCVLKARRDQQRHLVRENIEVLLEKNNYFQICSEIGWKTALEYWLESWNLQKSYTLRLSLLLTKSANVTKS